MKYDETEAKKYINKFNLSPKTLKTWQNRGEIPDYLSFGRRIDTDSKLFNKIRIVYDNKYLKYRRISKIYSIITDVIAENTKTVSVTDLHIELEAIEKIKQEIELFLKTEISTEESYISYFYNFVVSKDNYFTYSKNNFPNWSKKYNRFLRGRHLITKADLLEDVSIIRKKVYEEIWGEEKKEVS